jgi:hypothetical protein
VFGDSKFFTQWGLADDKEESMTKLIRKVCLSMSKGFNTPVTYWLELTVSELFEWTEAAKEAMEDDGG